MEIQSITLPTTIVSLFTREWIEISGITRLILQKSVSLFTREWIEMVEKRCLGCWQLSPSLRGSGLKCFTCKPYVGGYLVSLFTREWIEIKMGANRLQKPSSPSLRGSGLK